MADYSKSPYYDDYDASKGYTKILAMPGRVEQAREFTQAQTMMVDYLGRLGDAVYSNGTIIDGCSLIINDKQVTISSGRIYLDGLVRLVDGAVINITGVGNELIGAKIKQELVTEVEDPSLRDPAQNYENYGQAGAHRIKETVEFTLDDSESSIIYILNNGQLLKSDNISEEDSKLVETLARRTYDENGSYKVNGLELRDRSEADDQGIYVSITEGKAYVQGYEVTKQSATTIRHDHAVAFRQVLNEPKIYGSSNYVLNNQPVKELTQVVAIVEVTETIARGNISGGTDFLTNTPVVSVSEVKAGSKTYVQGTDYQLTNDGIDWSLNGEDPSIGSTYSVTYRYNRVMTDTDVKLVSTTSGDALSFIGSIKPVSGTTVLVDYNFYLSRKDLITMDKSGAYNIFKGQPDILRLVESPINQDDTQLIIGTVLIYANSNRIELSTYDSTRLSQANLYNLKKRVDDLEYNVALSDLDTEAAENESPTLLRGIFTDGFVGLSKSDTTNPEYNCSIDLDLNELTLPINSTIVNATPNTDLYETNVSKMGDVYMAPFVHELALRQSYATTAFLINPYAVYNPLSLIKLSPAVDNWIDSSKVVVDQSKTTAVTLRRWWYHRGESWAESEKVKWEQLTGTNGSQLGWSNYDKTSTTTTSQIILDDAIMYMRQIEVTATGSNFLPNSDNIECYFNDTVVPLTPTGSTKAGSKSGTVRANANGRFTAKFTVLKNTPCGSVNVVFKNANNSGTAIYRAQGRKQIIQETVLHHRIIVSTNDPLAQSFSFTADTVLTKLGLYFAAKDTAKNVVVQVRDMVNGYPGTTVYAEQIVEVADINTSTDASAVTEVILNQPVYCYANTQYCMCILSDSNNYQLWVATLGEKDVKTGKVVTSQPYTTGVMFSSSNAMTWTAHQSSDLKFDLYKAKYTGKGVIVFKDVNISTINRLVLAAQSIDYKNAGIQWYYRLSSTSSWLPLDTYVDRDLGKQTTLVQLKCELNVAYSTSPILAGDCVNLIGFMEKSEGAYLSKTVTMDNAFNTVVVSLEACKPTSTGFDVYIQTDGKTWTKLESPTIVTIDEEFAKYTYKKTVTSTKTFKVKIQMATSNPLVKPRIRRLMNILRNE